MTVTEDAVSAPTPTGDMCCLVSRPAADVNAQHAFLRDEGPRYDPALAGMCLSFALNLFHRNLM